LAIVDTYVTGSFVEDRNPNQFIGIRLPFYKSDGPEGYFASTSTTIDAVKENIKNLIQTEKGERYLQPDLGVSLRRHLFENLEEDVSDSIRSDIMSAFALWLPFVKIVRIDVNVQSGEDEYSRNSLKIKIIFSVDQIPNSLESVQVEL
jgi:phage baseplate assembly protein W